SLKETPPPWLATLTKVLAAGDAELTAEAVATARAVRWPKQRPKELVAALLNVGEDAKAPAGVRLAALVALPDGLPRVEPPLFEFLRDRLPSDRPLTERGLAAEALAHARLN